MRNRVLDFSDGCSETIGRDAAGVFTSVFVASIGMDSIGVVNFVVIISIGRDDAGFVTSVVVIFIDSGGAGVKNSETDTSGVGCGRVEPVAVV